MASRLEVAAAFALGLVAGAEAMAQGHDLYRSDRIMARRRRFDRETRAYFLGHARGTRSVA